MKEIIIKVPDEFTDEQIEFIKQSAINQIAEEIRKELKVPQADLDAAEVKIEELKTAMAIEPKVELQE